MSSGMEGKRNQSCSSNHKAQKETSLQRLRSSSLDETMEQIFHPSIDRFSLADLGADSQCVETKNRFCESDYQSHRRESLHHHQPLHKLYHRHKKSCGHRTDQEEPSSPSSVSTTVAATTQQETLNVEPNVEDPLISIPEESQQNGSKVEVQFYLDSPPPSSLNFHVSTPKRSFTERIGSVLHSISSPFRSAVEKHSHSKSLHSYTSPSLNSPSSADSASKTLLQSSSSEVPIIRVTNSSSSTQEQFDANEDKLKVTFQVGEEGIEEQEKPAVDKISSSKKPHRHSKKYHRHGSLAERQHQGSDLESKKYHDVVEPEEGEMLQIADIDDLKSHRYDNPKAIRRHKISDKNSVSSFMQLSKKDGSGISQLPLKKVFDHQPHEIFVELNELQLDAVTQEEVWRETARWIKYEEDVEVSVDRWGKPHIPSLTFNSLLNLRYCLESGVVILDLEESEFISIVKRIVEAMVISDQLQPEHQALVVKTLLARHRHANEKSPTLFMRRSTTAHANVGAFNHEKKSPRFLPARNKTDNEIYYTSENHKNNIIPETAVLIPNDGTNKPVEMISPVTISPNMSTEELSKLFDMSILRRIPVNAEGTTVLVGGLDVLNKPAAAFVRLSEGIVIPHLLEIPLPVRFLFILLGPEDDLELHEIGRSMSTLMSNREFHEAAYKANESKDILHAINHFLQHSVVIPPGDVAKSSLLPVSEIRRKSVQYKKDAAPANVKEEQLLVKTATYDPLQRTGRCFGGFIHDIKNRFPWYLSDIYDGINMQGFASTIFIYFAALSGAIAFGGLLGDKTNQLIGVSETLIATCVSGILFSLLSCQPLVILGTTGPVLLFDEILFKFCQSQDIDFLRLRVWIGIWTAVIATIVVAFEGSTLVRFFSRFMQEIYATIISMMFIFESFSKLYNVFLEHPLQLAYEDTGQANITFNDSTIIYDIHFAKPNTALLSVILMIGTFYIALFLRHFRNSIFLGRNARRALGDFGVPIAMALMVAIDYAIKDVYTEKLNVPSGLSPSKPDVRGWFISPLPISASEFFIAALAGILIFILLFLETLICELIISKKERKIKKGSGFHADMIVVGFITIGSAVIGGPWISAATVRSISHVSSLTVMSKTHAPGEAPHIVEVKEQRLTNFFVALLVGISVLMTPILRQVPVAVLFGVFLYMGVSSLSGIQLYERFLLMFVPTKHHPDFPYVKRVRTCRMHFFTVIQVCCIVVLWAIKSTVLAPGFPLGLLLLILLHYLLKRIFTPQEIRALDGEGHEEEELEEDEPDFYEQIVA